LTGLAGQRLVWSADRRAARSSSGSASVWRAPAWGALRLVHSFRTTQLGPPAGRLGPPAGRCQQAV